MLQFEPLERAEARNTCQSNFDRHRRGVEAVAPCCREARQLEIDLFVALIRAIPN